MNCTESQILPRELSEIDCYSALLCHTLVPSRKKTFMNVLSFMKVAKVLSC